MSERTADGQCRACKHWHPADDAIMGRCRRYPPKHVDIDDSKDVFNAFPIAMFDDWCGEHTPDPKWRSLEPEFLP